jgi:hypothetical protein
MAIPVFFKNSLLFFLPGKSGKPVNEAAVFLEPEKGDVPVAFQLTGKSGKATFNHLDKGAYKIVLTLPDLAEKHAGENLNLPGDFQFGYHNAKKKYFIREAGGFFMIRFSKLKNLAGSNIIPTFKTDDDNPFRRVAAKFEVENNFGGITMQIRVLSEKKFRKLINKYKNDMKMTVVENQMVTLPKTDDNVKTEQ